jgi:hypothetical protein
MFLRTHLRYYSPPTSAQASSFKAGQLPILVLWSAPAEIANERVFDSCAGLTPADDRVKKGLKLPIGQQIFTAQTVHKWPQNQWENIF